MERFCICVIYTAKSSKDAREFILDLAREGIIEKIRAEDGCEKYEYFLSLDNPGTVVLYEEWREKKCQEIHMTQEHMKAAMEIKNKYIEKTEIREISFK